MIQMIFEKLNLIKNNDFDETAGKAYMESHLKDSPDWLPIVPGGVAECHKFLDPHIDEIQKATNLTKEECNMKYFIVTHCLDLYAFAVKYFYIEFFANLFDNKIFSSSIVRQHCIQNRNNVKRVKTSSKNARMIFQLQHGWHLLIKIGIKIFSN